MAKNRIEAQVLKGTLVLGKDKAGEPITASIGEIVTIDADAAPRLVALGMIGAVPPQPKRRSAVAAAEEPGQGNGGAGAGGAGEGGAS